MFSLHFTGEKKRRGKARRLLDSLHILASTEDTLGTDFMYRQAVIRGAPHSGVQGNYRRRREVVCNKVRETQVRRG
ncbi:hypothetical protein O3P69_000594 [Scylla paramamosain]|uniref:Uncharacterized protein n=1 Tax=Scylla paramamosain TaxID=85552 RepID=A0AAW0UQ82_SCYPA